MKPIIVDVREPDEYAESHASGALNIPLGHFASGIPEVLEYLAKDQPIVVYCNSGNRAGKAAESLGRYGFIAVANGINQVAIESRP